MSAEIKGDEFTLVLQVYESAGLRKQRFIEIVEELITQMTNGEAYIYGGVSKIHRQTKLEVTGVWRNPDPTPVVPEDLRNALEFYINLQRDKRG